MSNDSIGRGSGDRTSRGRDDKAGSIKFTRSGGGKPERGHGGVGGRGLSEDPGLSLFKSETLEGRQILLWQKQNHDFATWASKSLGPNRYRRIRIEDFSLEPAGLEVCLCLCLCLKAPSLPSFPSLLQPTVRKC